MLLFSLIFFSLFAFNMFFKKSKIIYIITIIFLWIIMTFTYNNADETVYLSRYTSPALWKGNTELLFGLLINVCRSFKLSFIQYKGVLSFIELLLVSLTVWKLSKTPNIIISLYMFYPFVMHVSQIRNALAVSVFVFGYRYLLNDDKNYFKNFTLLTINDIKYVICIIIASLIHSASIFWLILLLAKKLEIKSTIFFTMIFSAFIIIFFNPSSINFLLSLLGASSRMGAYMSMAYQSSDYRHYSSTYFILLVEIIVFLTLFLIRRYISRGTDRDKKSYNLVIKINILLLISIAFVYRFTSEMYRPVEGAMILNYIVIINLIPAKLKMRLRTTLRAFTSQLLIYLCPIMCFFMMAANKYNFTSIVEPIYKYNYFFNWLLH